MASTESSLSILSVQNTLCDECAKFDLEAIFSTSFRPQGNNFKRYFALPGVQWVFSPERVASCSLCQLFATARVHSDVTSRYSLCRFSYVYEMFGIWTDIYDRPLEVIILVGVIPEGVSGWDDVSFNESLRGVRFICKIKPSNQEILPGGGYYGRLLLSHFDYSITKEWLNTCHADHEFLCSNGETSLTSKLKVINCETYAIEFAPPECSYAALSYVWGTSRPSGTVEDPSSGLEVGRLPENLPKVITDAITVAKGLGTSHLWIDKYCIDQQDISAKQYQLQNMWQIYRNADYTIVAAAGENEDDGLPGVSSSRIPNPVTNINGTSLAIVSNYANLIKSSKWNKRGWTYQEVSFSRRRLVFTKEQVYFQCNTNHACEAIYEPTPDESLSGMSYFINVRDILGEDEAVYVGYSLTTVKLRGYWKHIKNFTKRELTYDSDAINAVLGLLEAYTLRQPKIYHFWGLPLILTSEYHEATISLSHALSWNHPDSIRNPATSRSGHGFPTWSWAAWKGTTNCAYPFFDWIAIEPRIECWLEDKDGNLLELDKVTRALLRNHLTAESQLLPCLHLKGWFLKPDLWNSGEVKKITKETFDVQITTGSNKIPMMTFSINVPAPLETNPSLLQRLKGGEILCVHLIHYLWEVRYIWKFLLLERVPETGDMRRCGVMSYTSKSVRDVPELGHQMISLWLWIMGQSDRKCLRVV